MVNTTPAMATDRHAAALLDMKPKDFRALVSEGHLPPPRMIAGRFERWDTEELLRIARGDAAHGMSGVKW